MHGTEICPSGKVVAFSDRCPRALFLSLVVESGGGGGEDQKMECVCMGVCVGVCESVDVIGGCHCVRVLCGM
jgi:hypothetical protein